MSNYSSMPRVTTFDTIVIITFTDLFGSAHDIFLNITENISGI